MLRWKVLVFAVILCGLYTRAAGQRNKVLYPAALRVKRGVVNPTFQNSVEDAELLFEILLAGVRMGDGRGGFSVLDAELASLRRTRVLASVCEDVLPRKLTDVRRLTSDLSRHRGHLRGPDFERTVLTMVYAAYKLANTTGHQRDRWAESFLSLFRAIKQDLTVQ
ncbi:protein FAM180A-like isoform X2 [Anguilla rostrata]|uniref:protein FAM180A-like isoform X2 n=1 Tax=Anguilla rostrata TaxID=7938 RepID=UPI0030D5B9A5